MNESPDGGGAGPDPARIQLESLHQLVAAATHRLLGDTIAVSDEDWRGASRLPGWSRGHVATHLARQADALVRLSTWAAGGERQLMYASPQQRDIDIEAGAGRSGLNLQIDLDTSAGRLAEAWDVVESAAGWDVEIEMRGGLRAPARTLPLARLTEVVLHHVDLDVGYDIDDVDDECADWLLEWAAFRLRHRDEFPALILTTGSDFSLHVGSTGSPLTVTGTLPQLLGWLTSRSPASSVEGAGDLVLPAF